MIKKHTETPWDYCVSNNSNLIHIETFLENHENGGTGIATVNSGNKEKRLANAAFIVRAVNNHDSLIEALEILLTQTPCDREKMDTAMCHAVNIATRALKGAKPDTYKDE